VQRRGAGEGSEGRREKTSEQAQSKLV
jgi:hypothetical protein